MINYAFLGACYFPTPTHASYQVRRHTLASGGCRVNMQTYFYSEHLCEDLVDKIIYVLQERN